MATRRIASLFLLLGLTRFAPAQARPTATRQIDGQVGGGYLVSNSDYATTYYRGIFGYADLDVSKHFGAEVEVHQVFSPNNDQVHERTYELGARYRRDYGPFAPYAKLMVGRGVFNFPNGEANLAYNLGAIGGGVDVRVRSYLNVRGEFEYQRWFGFPNNGLTPRLFSIGAAYHFK